MQKVGSIIPRQSPGTGGLTPCRSPNHAHNKHVPQQFRAPGAEFYRPTGLLGLANLLILGLLWGAYGPGRGLRETGHIAALHALVEKTNSDLQRMRNGELSQANQTKLPGMPVLCALATCQRRRRQGCRVSWAKVWDIGSRRCVVL